ncbi:MAG: hypothetical protein H5U40_08545, partial [Polyangiaceae bacterium]|nr:hypothetical protein [Polyangiaceae bacterium]
MMRRLSLSALVFAFVACGGGGDAGGVDLSRPVNVDLDSPPPERLSTWNLFSWSTDEGFAFNERVVPYDMNTPLFSDYALKQRAIYLPEGAAAVFDPVEAFDFPIGTVLIKNFYFPDDFRAPEENLELIETRLLVRHTDGWRTWPYVWDAEQRDARLAVAGEVRTIAFIDAEGAAREASYLVPQRNQCQSCHARTDDNGSTVIVPIGPKARHLNRTYDYGGDAGLENQLTHLAALGMLEGLPPLAGIEAAYDFSPIEANGPSAVAPEDLDRATRDYLDVNCAHCHNA